LGKTKSYSISKHVVLDAFKRVKANRGSAGVDGETIEEFEISLKSNLYKLWNRMSSGPTRMRALTFWVIRFDPEVQRRNWEDSL
jgi:RNA-directed DNA polymerase